MHAIDDTKKSLGADFDVVIIGAGISGINAAYHLQTTLPGHSYTILESRGGIGGTWDFFKYPGLRSDSDLHTFGFRFRPWPNEQPIGDGPSIAKYIKETAADYGIDRHVQFYHKLVSADWSSPHQLWELSVKTEGQLKTLRTRFVVFGSGYYDYETPLPVVIPGIDNFKGTKVHPQFWPEDLDYAGKNVVVIGSGATAITLIPNLAEKAASVTMLQRSPTYLLTMPNQKRSALSRFLIPKWLSYKISRLFFLVMPYLFFRFCRAFPNVARLVLRGTTSIQLPKRVPHDPHFKPPYNPWEQRLCVCPDGDFFKTLRDGKANVATGHIKTVSENSITLTSGQVIKADIIVTATGLKVQVGGGAKISVDGEAFNFGEKFFLKGYMTQDLPNAALVIGYTNASWTLGADVTARMVCRLLSYMKANNISSAIPRAQHPESMKVRSVFNLNSTYVQRASSKLPMCSDSGPWKPRDNYFSDFLTSKFSDITEAMEFRNAPA
jgi:cation diffusion facilitator CzcD-associated flavoprotein CzcO